MFRLVNKHGTVTVTAANETYRDRLIRSGYKLVEEKVKGLDNLTVAELEAYAKEKGIDLKDCGNKADKLARIKEAESCQ